MTNVRLRIGANDYGGWKEIRIQRSMEQIAGKFQLVVTDRWSSQAVPRPIRPGAECQVLIDGAPVITGYVDDVGIVYNATEHTMSISGRDKTGDLVDCSVPIGSSLSGQTLLTAAQRLCKPFGIPVSADVDVGAVFSLLRPNPGDSVFNTLDAGARVRAVLLVSDGNGNLLITRASNERIPAMLLLGDNVLAASANFSHMDRFRDYLVVGQQEAQEQNIFGFHITGTATDSFIDRHRPAVITADNLAGPADAGRRAKWDRNVRFGRSQVVQYTVQGWHYEPDKLWQINRMVAVRDERLGLDVDRLITGVTFSLNDNGTRTELTLMPREAFELIELPEKGDNWHQI